jgi:hypothetical protein
MIPPVLTATSAELYCDRTRRKLVDITLGTHTASILAEAIRRSCSEDVTARPEALVLEIGRGLHRARIGPWLAVVRRLYAISFDRSAHLPMLALVEYARRDLAARRESQAGTEHSTTTKTTTTSTPTPRLKDGSVAARGSTREGGRGRPARRSDDVGVGGDVTAEMLDRVDAQIAGFGKHCPPLAALSATIGRIMSHGGCQHRDIDRRRHARAPAVVDCNEFAAALAASDPEWDSAAFRPMWFALGMVVPTDEAAALTTLARALFPGDPLPPSIDATGAGHAAARHGGSGTMSAGPGGRSNGHGGPSGARSSAADRTEGGGRALQNDLEVIRMIRAWIDERMPSLRLIPAEDLELVLEGIGIQHAGGFTARSPESESDPIGMAREIESSPSPAQRFAEWDRHVTKRILPVLRELTDHARHPLPVCEDAAPCDAVPVTTETAGEVCDGAGSDGKACPEAACGGAHACDSTDRAQLVARVRALKALALISRGASGASGAIHRTHELEAIGEALRDAFDGLTHPYGGVSPRHWRAIRGLLHAIDAALDVRASRFDLHASPYLAGDSAVVPACMPPLLGPGAARAILRQSARLDGPFELARQRRNEARAISRAAPEDAPHREGTGAADLSNAGPDVMRVDPRMLHALRYLTGECDLAPPTP